MTLPIAFAIYTKLHQNYPLLNENRCHHSMLLDRSPSQLLLQIVDGKYDVSRDILMQ